MNYNRRVGVDRADLTRGTVRLTAALSGYENSNPGTSPDPTGKPVTTGQFRHASIDRS